MNQKKNFVKAIIAAVLLLAIVAVMALIYTQVKPQGSEGSKKVVIEVIIPEEETKEFTLKTDAEFLRQALEEEKLVKGIDSEYGLYITEVNGRVVNEANQEWWCITKDGEQLLYGVDQIVINDGDHYEITLTVGF